MRQRLVLGFVAFALVVIALFEVPLGISLSSNARTTAIGEVERDAASLGLVVGAALERGDTVAARAVIVRFALEEDAVVVVVADGRPLLAAGVGAVEELTDPTTKAILSAATHGRAAGEEGSNDDDDYLYTALPLDLRGGAETSSGHDIPSEPTEELLVVLPAAPLHTQVDHYWIALSAFGAAMLAVAAILGVLLARSLLGGLAVIETAVSHFGAGRLSERAPATKGPAELRALAVNVNRMAGRLEELLRTQRSFVADASHQLRTPMTALRLRLENLGATLGSDEQGDLGSAIAEADRLSRVVDGLLSLARSEGARPEREQIDVAAIIHERVDAWSPLAEERGVTLDDALAGSASAGTTSLEALACPGYLEQVLDNLLSNALDATPATGTVSLDATHVGDDIEIRVIDNGPGMSTEDRGRAFDRFWRREGSTHTGTGLGLAIVAQLVRASGGTTWLDASEGGGVTAVVQLVRR